MTIPPLKGKSFIQDTTDLLQQEDYKKIAAFVPVFEKEELKYVEKIDQSLNLFGTTIQSLGENFSIEFAFDLTTPFNFTLPLASELITVSENSNWKPRYTRKEKIAGNFVGSSDLSSTSFMTKLKILKIAPYFLAEYIAVIHYFWDDKILKKDLETLARLIAGK